jgi:N-acetyl-gamma-glutamyl-phosphate reductase
MTQARAALAATSAPPAEPVRIGILGVSGYGGLELVRLLAGHPRARLAAASSRQYAGQPLGHACGALQDGSLVLDADLAEPAAWLDRGVETVFAALPHGAFAARARKYLDAGLRVVDLAADFRLRDAAEYERRYGLAHPDPALLASAVYGLSEWADDAALRAARLVANPGCYATAILLAALPAVAAGWESGGPLLVNALSGVSGAGRVPTGTTHFVECGENAAPYKVGETHAHLGEVRQALRRIHAGAAWVTQPEPAGAADIETVFNPHLVPMARGILATVAIPLARRTEPAAAQALYAERYAQTPCVRVLAGDMLPETRHVRGSNRCDLAVRVVANGTLLLVFAAIDNLGKGAAGQAVQNWNRMQGWPETLGLPLDGWMVG